MKNKHHYLSGTCVVAGIVLMLMSVMGGIRRHYIPPVERPIELVHDFGFIKAGEKYTHVFELKNPTATPWSVADIATSCRCTVPEFSWDAIPPGESAEVRLAYSAPDANVSEKRKVGVRFHESEAPEFHLIVRAVVRQTMVPSHERVQFQTLEVGQTESKRIVVRNYSTRPWRAIRLVDPPPWLTVRAARMNRRPNNSLEREQWAVDLVVTHTERGRSQLKARCPLVAEDIDGARLGDCHVTVTAHVIDSVVVSPQELLIPRHRKAPESFRLTVNFVGEGTPNPSDFRVAHNLGDQFRYEWARVLDPLWSLECFLPPDLDLPDDARLSLELMGTPVEIPVRLMDE